MITTFFSKRNVFFFNFRMSGLVFSFVAMMSLLSCQHKAENPADKVTQKLQTLVDSLSNVLKGLQNTAVHSPIEGLQDKYETLKQSVLYVVGASGSSYSQGTAFVIGENGLAISNHHVFRGMEEFVLIDSDGQKYPLGKVLYQDSIQDFIVFRIPNSHHRPLSIATETPQTGDHCFTIGNPQGLSFTLSTGIISALRPNRHLIQLTAEIAPGSSGGPLFNAMGEVIGITTSTIGEANLNFALSLVNLGENDQVVTPPEWAINFIREGNPTGNDFTAYFEKVEAYYRAVLENNWQVVRDMYAPVLWTYKLEKNVPREDILQQHIQFFQNHSAEFYNFNYDAYKQFPEDNNHILTTSEIEYELLRTDGIPLNFNIKAEVIFNENGEIVSVKESLIK